MITTADEDEPIPTADNYERTKHAQSIGAAVSGVAVVEEFSAIAAHDEAFWKERDEQVAKQRAAEAELQRADAHRMRAKMLRDDQHCFPATAVDAALAQWPSTTQAMVNAAKFSSSDKRLLVLAGGVGTGKSSAATWAALEVGGSEPAFVRANELAARGNYDRELRPWLRTRSMLVLDDLGAEMLDDKGVFRSLLDEVVDLFYSDKKRLVITTNLRVRRSSPSDEKQFAERYGDRVTSRFAQSGLWADCGVVDLRRVRR